MGCLLRPTAGGVSSFQMACAERRRLGAPPAKVRKQSGKPPGFDERWVPWEELLRGAKRKRSEAAGAGTRGVFGRDVLLHRE